jgi:Ni,Fe-hydrogenase III large subunit
MNFFDLLEYCVPERFFLISTDILVREKVNETLSKIAGGVAQLSRKSRGRVRIDLDKRVRKFHLFEIMSVQDELRENGKGNA